MSKDSALPWLFLDSVPPSEEIAVERSDMAKILVVDDEPIIAMTMGDWLSDLGHDVVGPAGDLDEALALGDVAIDAAILDVSLGQRTTEALAERLVARGVPFAVASGHDAAFINSVFARGLPLPKPFGFETFRKTVEALLGAPVAALPD
jgi:CheY-like chemotaxis protein